MKWDDPVVQTSAIRSIRVEEGKLTNQLIGFDVPESLGIAVDHALYTQLNELVAAWKADDTVDDLSIYVRRMNSGLWFAVNEAAAFSPAGMLKVALMMEYLHKGETDPRILSRHIVYDGSFDYNDSEIVKPSEPLRAGEVYTVFELIERMIRYSDNNANHLLLTTQTINPAPLSELFESLRLPEPGWLRRFDSMSSNVYSTFFRALYNATYLSRGSSERALELLSKSEFREGIVAGVPGTITVAHKFGERLLPSKSDTMDMREFHDCGIVYYPKYPYFLCVMTRGKDFNALVGVVRKTSEVVYRAVEDRHAGAGAAGG